MFLKTPNEWKLFDLENDPLELNDEYSSKITVQSDLKNKLISWINR